MTGESSAPAAEIASSTQDNSHEDKTVPVSEVAEPGQVVEASPSEPLGTTTEQGPIEIDVSLLKHKSR